MRDFRTERGSLPATTQLAEKLKAWILQDELRPGVRLPSEREIIEESGLSRITVRGALSRLEREGFVVRRQGLGTFVAEPVRQELVGVRTIVEVLQAHGLDPRVEVLRFGRERASRYVSDVLRRRDVLRIERLYRDPNQPVALVTIFLPSNVEDAAEPLRTSEDPTETTYTMWESRLGVRIKEARHTIHAAGASPEVAKALGIRKGAPTMVLERLTFAHDGQPLELVIFHFRPERYAFSVTLPRATNDAAGMVMRGMT